MIFGEDQKFVSEGVRKLLPGWTESCFPSGPKNAFRVEKSCFLNERKIAFRFDQNLLAGWTKFAGLTKSGFCVNQKNYSCN